MISHIDQATGNSRFETEKFPRQSKNSRKFPLLKMNSSPSKARIHVNVINLSVIMVCETVIKCMPDSVECHTVVLCYSRIGIPQNGTDI